MLLLLASVRPFPWGVAAGHPEVSEWAMPEGVDWAAGVRCLARLEGLAAAGPSGNPGMVLFATRPLGVLFRRLLLYPSPA